MLSISNILSNDILALIFFHYILNNLKFCPAFGAAGHFGALHTYVTFSFRKKNNELIWFILAASWENLLFAYAKTKAQISCSVLRLRS